MKQRETVGSSDMSPSDSQDGRNAGSKNGGAKGGGGGGNGGGGGGGVGSAAGGVGSGSGGQQDVGGGPQQMQQGRGCPMSKAPLKCFENEIARHKIRSCKAETRLGGLCVGCSTFMSDCLDPFLRKITHYMNR